MFISLAVNSNICDIIIGPFQFLYHTVVQHLKQFYNLMKAVESKPPYLPFLFIACLTTLGNKTKSNKHLSQWYFDSIRKSKYI